MNTWRIDVYAHLNQAWQKFVPFSRIRTELGELSGLVESSAARDHLGIWVSSFLSAFQPPGRGKRKSAEAATFFTDNLEVSIHHFHSILLA